MPVRAIKISIIVVLLPLCVAGGFVHSVMFNMPISTGGAGGLGEMMFAFTVAISSFGSGIVLWLYSQLFNFRDSPRVKIPFLLCFVAYLAPYIIFTVNFSGGDGAVFHDWRDDYYRDSFGVFLSFIWMGLLLAFSKLNFDKGFLEQGFAGTLASVITALIVQKIYLWFVTTGSPAECFHNICSNIYALLPSEIQNAMPYDGGKRGFIKNWLDMSLFSIVNAPIIAMPIHKLLFSVFCSEDRKFKKPMKNIVTFINITCIYLLIISFVTYFHIFYFPYQIPISFVLYLLAIWYWLIRKIRIERKRAFNNIQS